MKEKRMYGLTQGTQERRVSRSERKRNITKKEKRREEEQRPPHITTAFRQLRIDKHLAKCYKEDHGSGDKIDQLRNNQHARIFFQPPTEFTNVMRVMSMLGTALWINWP